MARQSQIHFIPLLTKFRLAYQIELQNKLDRRGRDDGRERERDLRRGGEMEVEEEDHHHHHTGGERYAIIYVIRLCLLFPRFESSFA
jgi:hypothetical protein